MRQSKPKAVEAYELIEDLIIFQEIAPGSLVSEAVLTDLTGFGRAPVREALQRLAREGMVEIHPSRGVLITPMSLRSELRLLELLKVLEVLTVQLACSRARPEHRHGFSELMRRLEEGKFSMSSYLGTVKEIQNLLSVAADNSYVADALAPAQTLSRRFWVAHVRDEHAEIAIQSALFGHILQAVFDRTERAARHASLALIENLAGFACKVGGK